LLARRSERNWSFHEKPHRYEPIVPCADISYRREGVFSKRLAAAFSAADAIQLFAAARFHSRMSPSKSHTKIGLRDRSMRCLCAAIAARSSVASYIQAALSGRSSELSSVSSHVLMDIEYEIEPAVEVVSSVRYPHQQFGLK
jgi:hypothetical protein